MKGNKGITLIALVITIIVLLILAGVSIAMLSGDNSILGNARKASDDTKVANGKEAVAVDLAQVITDWYQKTYAPKSGETAITTSLGDYITSNFTADKATPARYTISGTTITIVDTSVTGTLSVTAGSEGRVQWSDGTTTQAGGSGTETGGGETGGNG
ncbi:MAG: hypothetical protein IJK18_07510 [Clostridia bacterium]|nr:hypothetical protein [Clostridia bacterium]